MSKYMYYYVLILFIFPCTIFTHTEFLLTSTDYFHHIYCYNHLSIKINSIKFVYHVHNCTFVLHHHNNYGIKNTCSNQSSCIINLKAFLFFHIPHYFTKCSTTKLKFIRLNYTCINNTFISINDLILSRKNSSYEKSTIIVYLCILIFAIFFGFICSYLRHSSRNNVQKQEMSIVDDTNNSQLNTQSIYDNQSKQEYELKNISLLKTSSSSTLTSFNNKNIITNLSEYDNLTKYND
ncbi:unnamed protein product [Adineta steineri]|uniref:Transmembrane protein n=1 Tax=Adineta steineri TaxID=433720 RepID=A0A815MF62_9BILA|nr:unnamed protein product [Adineta steineri]CAF3958569.1 unnamed protein product [Adineta steineri]